MVDAAVLARKMAAIRDAVGRIREVLPETPAAFLADRTAREVVTLNLFLARPLTLDHFSGIQMLSPRQFVAQQAPSGRG